MTQIRIDLTDAQIAALRDIAIDPKEWITNMIIGRVYAAVQSRKIQTGWISVALDYAGTGGNPEDDEAVLAHGIATGAFKDAATRQSETVDI